MRNLKHADRSSDGYLRLEAARLHTYAGFDSRIPPPPKYYRKPKSLTKGQIFRLWDILDPKAVNNPFKGKFARYRNALIFRWLILLGLRRGELLGARIDDVTWDEQLFEVKRRQDNKEDSRKREARAKTLPGVVPMSDDLLTVTHEYLTDPELRPAYADENNPFFFVSRNGGGPLTESGLQRIFEKVRTSFPELPENLSPHICRHTANYILSEAFDAEGVSPADEMARRRALMRWSPNSRMPEHYNQRRIREKANASSLKSQVDMFARRQKHYEGMADEE